MPHKNLSSLLLATFCLLIPLGTMGSVHGASPKKEQNAEKQDSRSSLVTITQERLNAIKKGGTWELEIFHGKRSLGQIKLSLSYHRESNTLTWEERIEGAYQQHLQVTFLANKELTLAGFESVRPPTRSPAPRTSSGKTKANYLHGVDADGDSYSFPDTHDFLPYAGLTFLLYAVGPQHDKDLTIRPFDDSVQDLLAPITLKSKANVTCKSGGKSYVCTQFASKNRRYWISAAGQIVKQEYSLNGNRFTWTMPKPKDAKKSDANAKSAQGIDKKALAAIMKKAPETGILIYKLSKKSNGFKAGLRTGDIITSYNDSAMDSLKALQKGLAAARASKKKSVPLKAYRAGQSIDLEIKPGKLGIYPISLTKGKPAKIHSGGMGAPKRKAPKDKFGKRAWTKSGTAIPWRNNIDAAKEEAKTEHKPIMWWAETADTSPGYDIELLQNYQKVGIFSDPVLVDFIKRRFVSYKGSFNKDLQYQFKLPKLTAPALVFFHPDGRCLHWVDAPTTLNQGFFIKLFKSVAKSVKQKKSESQSAQEDQSAPAQIEALLADFEAQAALDKSEALIKKLKAQDQAHLKYLQGKAYRYLRNATQAQEKLDKAWTQTTSEALKDDIQTERALLHLRMRNPKAALKDLQAGHSKTSKDPESLRYIEGRYLQGVALRLTQRDQEAREAWKTGAEMRKNDPWSLLCAAEYSGIGPFSRGFYCMHWLPEKAMLNAKGIRKNTIFPALVADEPQVIKEGVRYILDLQAADGGWNDTNYDFGNQMGNNPKGVDSMPNVRIAVSAVCARAILEWREAEGISRERTDAALEKAWAYLTNKDNVSWRDLNEQIYAHFYRLNFFAAWYPRAGEKRKQELKVEMQKIVDLLFKKKQDKKGLWRHEYPNGFVTSAVLLSMRAAQSAGVSIDPKGIAKAIKILKSVRTERGTWPYYPKKGSGPLAWKGSFGRNISAEAAFVAWSKGSDVALEHAIKKYLYWNFVQNRVRKHSFHSDKYGTGGFFFWFNAHAFGQALGLVRKEAAQKAATKFRAHVLSLRELDGSFIDSFELGKTYATGMALLVLDSCRDALEDTPKPSATKKN